MEVHIFDTACTTQFECQVPLVCVMTVVQLVGTNISHQNVVISSGFTNEVETVFSAEMLVLTFQMPVLPPLKSVLLPITILHISVHLHL